MIELGPSGKYRTKHQISEDMSERIFFNKIPVEWVCRKMTPDYGIDFEVETSEIYDKQKYLMKGEIVWIQLKSVQRINKNLNFSVQTGLLSYAAACTIPVLLVVVDLSTKSIYWLHIQEYLGLCVKNKDYDWCLNKTKTSVQLKEFNHESVTQIRYISKHNTLIQDLLLLHRNINVSRKELLKMDDMVKSQNDIKQIYINLEKCFDCQQYLDLIFSEHIKSSDDIRENVILPVYFSLKEMIKSGNYSIDKQYILKKLDILCNFANLLTDELIK